MNQGTLDGLQPDQKTGAKHIYFNPGNSNPNFSGTNLIVYENGNANGDLSLAQFPNIVKITFSNNIQFINLDSIDISENVKLCWLLMDSRYVRFKNVFCKLFVKESQINRVIVSYFDGSGIEKAERLKDQCLIPYCLVEDRKSEQLEAEVEKLKQAVAEKDQQIKDLQTETRKKPTLGQFQELNNIALPGSKLNYVSLKEEIKRLKLKDFAPYFRQQKDKFDQLTANSKNKAGDNLKLILELFLQTQKQIIERTNGKNDDFAKGQLQGQLTTCQTLLQSKLTQEELRSLLNTQEEILKLEEQSDNLQCDKNSSGRDTFDEFCDPDSD